VAIFPRAGLLQLHHELHYRTMGQSRAAISIASQLCELTGFILKTVSYLKFLQKKHKKYRYHYLTIY